VLVGSWVGVGVSGMIGVLVGSWVGVGVGGPHTGLILWP